VNPDQAPTTAFTPAAHVKVLWKFARLKARAESGVGGGEQGADATGRDGAE